MFDKRTIIKKCMAFSCAAVMCISAGGCGGFVFGTKPDEEVENAFTMGSFENMTEESFLEEFELYADKGVRLKVEYEYSEEVPEGYVIKHEPASGEKISSSGTVTVWISKGMEEIILEDFTGMSAIEAISVLANKDIEVVVNEEHSSEIEEGCVIRQLPTAGQVMKGNEKIRLFVSLGPELFKLEGYEGKMLDHVKKEIEELGFVVTVMEEYHDTVEKGAIIKQMPAAGEEVKKGDGVIFVVSRGIEGITVKDYSGYERNAAVSELEGLDVNVLVNEEMSETVGEGYVIRQVPAAGEFVKKGGTVRLFVSIGSGKIMVPDVIGLGRNEAERVLKEAGLKLGYVKLIASEKEKGTVLWQSVAAGKRVEENTQVEIYISDGDAAISESGL